MTNPQTQGTGEPATDRLERAVLAAETALIEFEIAVETFRVEVENFSRLHHQRLGPMYARLDELDAQIAEAVAALSGDAEDLRKAREARAVVLPMPGVDELFGGWIQSEGMSPEAQAMLTDRPVRPPQRVRPSEEARRMYRELVRAAHPDLAGDDADRARRDAFIVRVNRAYAEGDEAVLAELLEEWAAGPRPERVRLSRSEELYARLEWLAERKEWLAGVASELEESAIGAMLRMAPDDPDGLLDDIADKLLADVAERQARLDELAARTAAASQAADGGTGAYADAPGADGGPHPATVTVSPVSGSADPAATPTGPPHPTPGGTASVQREPVQQEPVQQGPVEDGPMQDGLAQDVPGADGPVQDEPAADGQVTDAASNHTSSGSSPVAQEQAEEKRA